MAAALVLSACAGSGQDAAPPSGSPIPAAPRGGSVFEHIQARYDANGDGVVTPAEYDRDGRDFTQLDRVPDGQLTPEDFAARGRRPRGLAADDARIRRAAALLGWYFQADDDSRRLSAAELAAGLAAYDADGNGRVGRREFEARSEARAAFGLRPAGRLWGLLEPETTDPWERTLLGVDTNDDGFATEAELLAFHAANRAAFDLALPPTLRAVEGQRAPDFTLRVHHTAERVTLSDFAGERPVALIFGSYT